MSVNPTIPNWDNVFSYTTEQISSLLAEGGAFFTTPVASNLDEDWNNIHKLQKRITRLELHAATLTEYCRIKRIPRGLRIQKAPHFFSEKKDFISRWCAILNKCSLDLMILIVETSNQEIGHIRTELDSSLTTVKGKVTDEDFQNKSSSLQDSINKLKEEVKVYKFKKFQRDLHDYETASVYPWLNLDTRRGSPRPSRPTRRVHFRDSSSDFSCSSTDDPMEPNDFGSASTSAPSSSSFLGRGRGSYRDTGGARPLRRPRQRGYRQRVYIGERPMTRSTSQYEDRLR